MAFHTSLVVDLLIAVAIGGLIGMERERAAGAGYFAGSRTLPLVALLGGLLQAFFPDVLWLGLAVVFLLVAVAYGAKVLVEGDIGLTTAVASLLTFVFGAMATYSSEARTLAVVLGGLTTVILASKTALHGFVQRIEEEERRAMLQFLFVAVVVLPLLPNRQLDVLLGLNPRFVWLMVVFISGIGLAGYLLAKYLGAEQGIGLTGLLGGLVSSTATTAAMATRSRGQPSLSGLCGLAAALSSLVMLPRILVEVAVVNRGLLWSVGLPVGAMLLVGGVLAAVLLLRYQEASTADQDLKNPFQLRSALVFAGLFALVLLGVRYLNAWFGEAGVYLSAVLSGVADVDAITLSMSRLALEGTLSEPVATTGIVLAAVTNTLVKTGIAWAMGTRQLGKVVTLVLGAVALTGIGAILLPLL